MKTKTQINILIVLQFYIVLFSGIFSFLTGWHFVYYLPDLLNILILGMMAKLYLDKKGKIALDYPTFFLLLYLVFVIISYFWSDGNLLNAIARIRYLFAGAIYYIAVSNYLTSEYYTKVVNSLLYVQIINFILVLYQNFILGLHPDFTNGIFGTGYANGILGMFCLASSSLAIIYYLGMKWSLLKSFSVTALSSIICALAEIKLYFVLFLLALFIIIVFQNKLILKNRRFLSLALGTFVLLFLSYKAMELVLPNNLHTFFSISNSLKYESRTEFAGRTNTIPFVLEHVFKNNYSVALFGKGLGAKSSDFIYELGKTFSDSGFIGVGLLYLFLLFQVTKIFKKGSRSLELLFTTVFSILVMASIIVWNATFTRTTYLIFFFLSVSNVLFLRKGEGESNG